MADKMAVMNGGTLQQYDTPKNVFAHPVNTFVASFVGSPAMSLVPVTVQRQGDAVVLVGVGDWKVPLSPANARKALAAKTDAIVLGARHSTITLHSAEVSGAIACKVYTVEPTGDVTFVQVYLDQSIVIISLDPNVPVEPDQPVWLDFNQDRIHLFDGETQAALQAV